MNTFQQNISVNVKLKIFARFNTGVVRNFDLKGPKTEKFCDVTVVC